ncbi:MAG: hypothetical protein EBX07_04585, partial [Burkholderiaceae bacterium]|nr:hypothetical protein [Burkholderiaceae bacterium]
MKIYQVGGVVRDRLLGRTIHDIDYVVVGSTADEMMQKHWEMTSYWPKSLF